MSKTGAPQGNWGQQKPMSLKSMRGAASPWLQGRELLDRAQVVKVLCKLGVPPPGHSLLALYKLWVSSLNPRANGRKEESAGSEEQFARPPPQSPLHDGQ